MSKLRIILCVLLIASASAVAQKTQTVPARGIHDTVGLGLAMIAPNKKFLPTRQQCLYAMQDLPASPILIREVAFQPVPNQSHDIDAALVTFTLDMSVGPVLPSKRSLTFAANHGQIRTRVFAGKIQLPIVKYSEKRDWRFRIPLSKAFVADGKLGPSLVLDFSTTSVVTQMNGCWPLIQGRQDIGAGKFQGVGYNCHFQKFSLLWQTFPGALYVGSKTDFRTATLLANQSGFLSLGDAGWGSKWGPLSMPIDLTPFGAPGCTWDVRPLVSFPLIVDGSGLGIATGIQIPNDPRLSNLNLYTQGAYTYPGANALGLLFLPSLAWRLGSGEDPECTAIASYTLPGYPITGVSNHWALDNTAPYCRITYY